MLTYFSVWDNLLYEYILGTCYTTPVRILLCLILSIFTVPIDILLLPFELLAIIIYKLIPSNKRGE